MNFLHPEPGNLLNQLNIVHQWSLCLNRLSYHFRMNCWRLYCQLRYHSNNLLRFLGRVCRLYIFTTDEYSFKVLFSLPFWSARHVKMNRQKFQRPCAGLLVTLLSGVWGLCPISAHERPLFIVFSHVVLADEQNVVEMWSIPTSWFGPAKAKVVLHHTLWFACLPALPFGDWRGSLFTNILTWHSTSQLQTWWEGHLSFREIFGLFSERICTVKVFFRFVVLQCLSVEMGWFLQRFSLQQGKLLRWMASVRKFLDSVIEVIGFMIQGNVYWGFGQQLPLGCSSCS
jgi:hypothetical protein